MLLETRGDYEFANKLTASLRELTGEIKRYNDNVNAGYKAVETAKIQAKKEASENWDITWTNIIDSMVETDTREDSPRFDVGQDDEILCKTEADANCVADFLKAIGFDGVCTAEDPEDKKYRWEIHPNS